VELLVEIIGWAGAAMILLAYILLSADRITGRSRAYQWMNVVGALFFIVNSGWHGAIPSASLNIVWMGIGLATLWRIARTPPLPVGGS